jgi:hypothetical protein
MDEGIATIQKSLGRLSANSPGNTVRYDPRLMLICCQLFLCIDYVTLVFIVLFFKQWDMIIDVLYK